MKYKLKRKREKIKIKITSKLFLVSALIVRFYVCFFEMPINGMSNQFSNMLTAFVSLFLALYIVSTIYKDVAKERYKRSRRKNLIHKIEEARIYEERIVNYD